VKDETKNPATYTPTFDDYASFLMARVGHRECSVCGHDKFSILTDVNAPHMASIIRLEREDGGSPGSNIRLASHYCNKCGSATMTDVSAILGISPYDR